MSMQRILITVIVVVILVAGAAYAYVAGLSDKPPQRFNLIADVPRNDASAIPSNERTEQALHDEIAIEVQKRLLAAYRTLAYADRGRWSLATWAQLQWVRDTLDGRGLDSIRAEADRSNELQDLSFVRLLYEHGRTASLNEKEQATAALRDGKAIVEELSAATPSTENPTDVVKNIAAQIKSSVGLHAFTSGFPKFGDVPLPSNDD
ncbi:hypothetical protein [Bradyrhizobium sp. RT10b]|uniref:hypothetical protein n=1 Tax=Bradyrhizobium sp. RT10b TaxID=3156331 RepID=UPI0033982B50